MVDFVNVILRTISGLDDDTDGTRQKVYEKARTTIRKKLQSLNPTPSKEIVLRQINALEDAITKVESFYKNIDIRESIEDTQADRERFAKRYKIKQKIVSDPISLILICSSLIELLKNEKNKLEEYLPNSSDEIARKAAQIDLLSRLLDGIEVLLDGISKLSAGIEFVSDTDMENTVDNVENIADDYSNWYKEHKSEAIDLSLRLPVVIASIGLLNQLGAEMTVATTAIFALVGGDKIREIVSKKSGK